MAKPSAAGTNQVFDAVSLELLWRRTISAVDEAAKALRRTSFSTLVNESNDFACVLTDASGQSLAQNTESIPSFIGTLPVTVKQFIKEIGIENMRPSDVLVTNTPWIATGHLNDITVAKPIFRNGRIVAFAASTAHAPDIGGKVRSVEPREVFEEGFHIPVMKFMNEGKPDQTFLKLLRAAVRTPDQTEGDLWAQITGLDLLDRRLVELMTEYGLDDLESFAGEILGRCENAMRAAIRALPDGDYTHEFQTDGLMDQPFTYRIAIKVAGDRLSVDYAGTSAQVDRAINCTMTYTFAMTAYALKCLLLPDLPNNEGIFRCIEVWAPAGTIVNPRFPAAVGGRMATGHYLPIAVFGALAPVIPERIMAASGSPLWSMIQTGRAPGWRHLRQCPFLQRRHGRHRQPRWTEHLCLAEQRVQRSGRIDRAQQPAHRAPQAASRGEWRYWQVSRRTWPGDRIRGHVGDADRRHLHGRALPLSRTRHAGRPTRRAGRGLHRWRAGRLPQERGPDEGAARDTADPGWWWHGACQSARSNGYRVGPASGICARIISNSYCDAAPINRAQTMPSSRSAATSLAPMPSHESSTSSTC